MARFKVGDKIALLEPDETMESEIRLGGLIYGVIVYIDDKFYEYDAYKYGTQELVASNMRWIIEEVDRDCELMQIKYTNTAITKKLYKEKIIEEKDGHLVVKLV